MRFSNKLSFAILITGMIILILSSFTVYKFSYDSIIKSEFRYTKSITEKVSGKIDQLLHEKVKTALTLANTPIIKKGLETSNLSYSNLSGEKIKESIKRLNEKWKSTENPTDNFIIKFTDNKVSRFLTDQQAILKGEYGEIFLTNKFGALTASTSKLSTFAHGHKYWWLGSYNNGEGAVFFDDRGYDASVGGYVLGLVVPVRKGTEIIGILKCNLNILGGISKLISGAKDKSIGKFKLARSGGMVVFEEGFEPLSTQVHDAIFKRLKSKNDESFIINDSGEKYLVGFSDIKLTRGEKGYGFGGTFESIDHKKGNAGESWYVICYRQMSVIQTPIIASIKWVVWIGIATILILVIVSQLFSRKIAKPLAILDKATEKVGKGDFEYRIGIRRKDEFGNLAHSFNNMASKLQQTTTSVELLEDEVKHRKQTEKALRNSEDKYRSLVETSSDWIWEVDQNSIYIYASPKVKDLLGYDSQQEVIGKTPFDHMPADEAKRVGRLYRDIVDSRKPFVGLENINLHKDGRQVVLETSGVPIFDEDGNLIGYRGVDRDISHRKQAEEDKKRLEAHLNQAQKMEAIGTLAGGIAHQFNNALSGITGNLDLLEMDLPGNKNAINYVKQMKVSAIRMAQLTAQLLAYARGGKYQAKTISVSDFVRETLPLVQHAIDSAIVVDIDLPRDILNVKADLTQMQMVLSAVLANASEAMEGKGRIRVAYHKIAIADDTTEDFPELKPGNYACLTITDDGKGMHEETRTRMFEPFFTTKFEGRGLGMAAVYGIVKNHDGWISVDSELGKGTTVKIYLPSVETPVQADGKKKPRTEWIKGTGTILVIDDEEAVVTVCRAMLERMGYRVLEARNGQEAIDVVKTFDGDIDFAMLDILMPGMSGEVIYPLLMKARPDLKVIVFSGYSIDGPVQKILDAGAEDFIQKPFTMSDLSEKLKKY